MQEEWKDVVGYDGLYQVSNFGNVKSFWCWDGHKYKKRDEPKILKPSNTSTGYKKVELVLNGERKSKKVHRLVAEAFIPNQEKKLFINHKDFNTINNNVDNLEWVTNKENILYSSINHRLGNVKGIEKKEEIVRLYKENTPLREIIKITGATKMSIYKITHDFEVLYFHSNKKYKIDRLKLYEDIISGLSCKEISQKYNISRNYVSVLKYQIKKEKRKRN